MRSLWGVGLVVLVVVSRADARSGTLKVDARLRQGPSAKTELLGIVAQGTEVEILGDDSGWRQVKLPDGRIGYLWGEHFTDATAQAAGAAPAPAPRAAAGEPESPPAGVVEAPPQPPAATAADIEHLRAEVERLRRVAERLEAQVRPVPVPISPAFESNPGLVPALLLVDGILGFAASRLLQRRRDRRQRNRLRV